MAPKAVLNLIPDCIPDGDLDLLVDLVLLQLGVAHAAGALARPPRKVRLVRSSSPHWDLAAKSPAVYTNAPWITAVLVAREKWPLVEVYYARNVHPPD